MEIETQKPTVLHLAPIWKRGVARLIDTILIYSVVTLPLFLATRLFVFPTSISSFSPFSLLTGSVFKLVSWLANPIYEAYFLTTSGQTVGKKLLNIMVISEEAKIIDLSKAILRIVIGFIPIEFLFCFFTNRKQCLHDIAAKTLVIDKEKLVIDKQKPS